MPAKLTLYPSEGASRHFLLREEEEHSIGRDPGNTIVLEDPRVSANHALLRASGDEWLLFDQKSKNGTFVGAVRVTEASLDDEDWISFGGLLTRFELVSEAEVASLRAERARRFQTFTEARRILDSNLEPRTLLTRLVGSVLELTGAERGLLLLFGSDGRLRAEVVSGSAVTGLVAGRFEGSFGAIERSIRQGRSVVSSNATADAYLGGRRSIVELGIETLACVPLRAEGKTIGLIYVDGRKRGGTFTDLDLEILEALAEHAAVVVGSLRLDLEIRELVGAAVPATAPGRPGFLEEFESRLAGIARESGEVAPAP